MRGGKGRLPRSSQTDEDCTAPPRPFHCEPYCQILDARGQWAAHAHGPRALFCAHPQAAVEMPTAGRNPHTSSGGAHACVATRVEPRLPVNIVHACAGARPSGQPQLEPGELGANSHRPWHSLGEHRGVRGRSAPWCSSRASLLGSLSRSLFSLSPDPSPALPPIEPLSSRPTEPISPAGTYL